MARPMTRLRAAGSVSAHPPRPARRRVALGIAGVLTLVLAACSAAQPPVESPPPAGALASLEGWAGTYRDLSDWELTLELVPNGEAVIQTRWWGESGSSLRRIRASWSVESGAVALHYGEVTDHLRLDRAPRPGQRGPLPRLTTLEPIHPRSLIGLSMLWSEPPAR